MNDRLKILISTLLAADSKTKLDEQLQALKLKAISVRVTLDSDAKNTLNKQLRGLKIKGFEIPIEKTAVQNAMKSVTSEADKSMASTLKKLSAYQTKLANIQQSAFGLTNPIDNSKHQENLSKYYKEIDLEINKIINSNKKLSTEQEIAMNKRFADVERLRKAYVELEKPAAKLDPKPIGDVEKELKANLKTLAQKWQNQGILVDSLKEKINNLRNLKIDDRQSLNQFRTQLKLASEEARQLNLSVRTFNKELAQNTSSNKLSIFMQDNPKAMKTNQEGFEQLKAAISDINSPAQQSRWNKMFADFKTGIKEMGQEGNTVFGSLLKNTQKFFGWLLASGSVMGAINTLRQSVSVVIELDKAIMNLRMATGYSFSETKKLLDTYTELGMRIGATTTEVAEAANSWLRQGLSIKDTNTMIENSLILSKVGMLSSAEATDYLTSATRGYNVAVKDSIGIIDMLTGVDLKAAVSAGGIAQAMSRTAASANLAGVEMSKLISYLTTVGEVTQRDMSSVGESFKTIFARMRDIKEGKDIDEAGESISNVEKVLSKVNIKLRDSTDSFRNFGDVIDGVGKNWKSYSSVQQAEIAKAFAGVRQQENFLVLMENFGKALEYNEIALNSAGTATEKMAAYDDSLDRSLKSLTTSFESFSSAFINSGLFKDGIDLMSGLLGIITSLVENFGVLGTTASVALGVFSAKNSGGMNKCRYATGDSNGNMNELRCA